MAMSREVADATTRFARMYQAGKVPTAKEADAARTEIATAQLIAHMEKILKKAPPLSGAQRQRLAKILTGNVKK